jgi:hypothetical protein
LGTFEQPNGSVYVINPKLISPDGTGIPANPQLSGCTPAVPGGFCNPQPGEVGNLQLDAFNGPVYFDWDASASKDFNITERFKLTFRAEAFNVLNHPVSDQHSKCQRRAHQQQYVWAEYSYCVRSTHPATVTAPEILKGRQSEATQTGIPHSGMPVFAGGRSEGGETLQAKCRRRSWTSGGMGLRIRGITC